MKKCVPILVGALIALASCAPTDPVSSDSALVSSESLSSSVPTTSSPSSSEPVEAADDWTNEIKALFAEKLYGADIPYFDTGVDYMVLSFEEPGAVFVGGLQSGSYASQVDAAVDVLLAAGYSDNTDDYEATVEGMKILDFVGDGYAIQAQIALGTTKIGEQNIQPEGYSTTDGYLFVGLYASKLSAQFPTAEIEDATLQYFGAELVPPAPDSDGIASYEVAVYHGSFAEYAVGISCYCDDPLAELEAYDAVLLNAGFVYDAGFAVYLSKDGKMMVSLGYDENDLTFFDIYIEANSYEDNHVLMSDRFPTDEDLLPIISAELGVDIEGASEIPVPGSDVLTALSFYLVEPTYSEFSDYSYALDIYVYTDDADAVEKYEALLDADENWTYAGTSGYYVNDNGIAVRPAYDSSYGTFDLYIEDAGLVPLEDSKAEWPAETIAAFLEGVTDKVVPMVEAEDYECLPDTPQRFTMTVVCSGVTSDPSEEYEEALVANGWHDISADLATGRTVYGDEETMLASWVTIMFEYSAGEGTFTLTIDNLA